MGTFSLLSALRPPIAALVAAVPLPPVLTTVNPCSTAPSLPCGSGGAAGANAYTLTVIVPALETAFLAVAIIYFFYYAIKLMLESDEDSVVSETKLAYGYAIGGAVMVTMATLIVQAVAPEYASQTLINQQPIVEGLDAVVFFFRLMVAGAVSAVIVFQGFRLILLQGNEGEMDQQKKRFFNGLIGVTVVTLGNLIVEGMMPSNNTPVLLMQIVGICNYLLQFFGALCVLAFLAAGFMLVVSADESLKDRAKKTLFTATISLIIVFCSLVIVNYVVAL